MNTEAHDIDAIASWADESGDRHISLRRELSAGRNAAARTSRIAWCSSMGTSSVPAAAWTHGYADDRLSALGWFSPRRGGASGSRVPSR